MLIALTPVSAFGQKVLTPKAKIPVVAQKAKASDKLKADAELKRKYPALVVPKAVAPQTSSQLKTALTPVNSRVHKAINGAGRKSILKLGDGRELWGNVAYQSTWSSDNAPYGMYTFNATSPLTVTELGLNASMCANGGSALLDDTYHSVYLDTSYSWLGYYFMYYFTFDTEDWTTVSEREIDDFSLLATETAVYTESGTVFGQFYTEDLSGLEFGVIDYSTMTRSTIGTSTNSYVALGITKERVMYGVASDGNLYKIDTTTGEETLVGPTGVTVGDDSGYYGQSGEIDQNTNTFYWASIDVNANSALYTVDLETGAATKIADFPASEQIYGLSIPAPAAESGAPAAPTDLSVAFEGGSLTGTVSFTAPSLTYGGDALTGDLTYKVLLDGATLAEGSTTAGAAVTAEVTVPQDGAASFVVIVSNSVGDGAKARVSAYVGYDTPAAVTDLSLVIDNTTGVATLTWTAPTTGLNGGYVGDLTYNIVRYPDNVTVATGHTGTTFTETIEIGSLTSYSYGVVAVNGTKTSAEATSNGQILGSALIPPYSETFDDASSLDLFTILDANEDSRTWFYYSSNVAYRYSAMNSGDDWLITAPLKLEANKVYTVSFNARSYFSVYPERLEVMYGNTATPEGLSNVILPATVLPEEATVYKYDIVSTEDQEIYIGFHAISDPDEFYLILDDIYVSAGSSTAAPDSVINVQIVPASNGDLTASVTFNAPANAISGNSLSALTKVEVQRNGELIKTFENPTPGASLTFTDETDVNGVNTYTFTAYNEEGAGRVNEVSAYIGVDVPAAVQNINAADNQTSIKLDWDQISSVGASGGIVIPEDVTYNIYDLVEDEYGYTDTLRIASVKETTYTVDINTTEGEQDLIQYAFTAENKAGKSSLNYSSVVLSGVPYTLPFFESAAGGSISYMWYVNRTGDSNFAISTSASSDGDGGSFILTPVSAGDIARICSGKISLAGATNPELIFAHYSMPGNDMKLFVEFKKPSGETLDVKEIGYSTMTGDAAWTTENIKFADEYKSLPYVLVNFRAEVGENATSSVYVDNINVRDVYEYDLAVSLEAPASLTKGQSGTINVEVSNEGEYAASGYTVNITDGDAVLATYDATEALAPFTKTEYQIPFETSVFTEASAANIKAEIVYSLDLYEDNNAASATIALVEPDYPTVSNVTASSTGAGEVTVSWVAPTATSETKTEDFESYDPWTIDEFGGWTSINADGGIGGGLFSSYSYGHQGEAFAYIVFNPEAIFEGAVEANPTLAPHSGEQYAAAIYKLDSTGSEYIDSDNWLISPLLSGEAQTVSFWASNIDADYPETFEVLYSTTGTAASDFVKLGDTYTASSAEWNQISVELPAGATYFAIRQTTSSSTAFMLMIDDITYTEGTATPIGFNIYRDEVKVGNVAADVASFTDQNVPDGSHTYAVTAVYATGESSPVSASIATAIESINAEAGKTYTVYTLDGKLIGKDINSLSKLKKGVYVINNKKVEVK